MLESGRWLLSKGRQEAATEVLEFTVKRNGKTAACFLHKDNELTTPVTTIVRFPWHKGIGYPVEMIRILTNEENAESQSQRGNIFQLLRDRSVARLSAVIWFGW